MFGAVEVDGSACAGGRSGLRHGSRADVDVVELMLAEGRERKAEKIQAVLPFPPKYSHCLAMTDLEDNGPSEVARRVKQRTRRPKRKV